tara:strand:+ start:2987 stop:3397 length:411 start_codon:yes stop_codon:yes gene_type:complete
METDIDEIHKQKPPSILISDNKNLQNIETDTQKIKESPTARYLSEISGGKKEFLIGLFSLPSFLIIYLFIFFWMEISLASLELFLFGFMILFIFYILAIIISFISKNIYLGLGLILSPFFTAIMAVVLEDLLSSFI